MNELTVKEFAGLPEKIEDLTKFVLFGREKLKSVRAEIRAIDQLTLATDVREQKLAEAQMLSGALLDAERKIGEFTLKLPKDNSFRGNQWQRFTDEPLPQEAQSDDDEKRQNHTGVKSPQEKPKSERIKELGLNRMQVHRFEVLAKNPDVVEQVKREAQENEDIPTRSRVLQLVKQKKSPEWKYKATRQVNDAIFKAAQVDTDIEKLDTWWNSLSGDEEQRRFVIDLDEAMKNLVVIRNFVVNKLGGKSRWTK